MIDAVRAVRVAAEPVAVVRRRAAQRELPRVVPEACGVVWNAVKAAGVKGAGRHVAIYRGGAGGLIDVEVGVEVPGPIGASGVVVDSTTPGGEAATVTHFGPYGGLGEAHRAIREWCDANGRAPAGPNWEVYGHWVAEWNEEPGKIRTDVFYLLRS
jgi:effector-binding domain-containing protein